MKSGIPSEGKCHIKNLFVESYCTEIRVFLTLSLLRFAAFVPSSEKNIFTHPIPQITTSI